ncbi:MAG TPA: aquaporin [Saprospiraceae bacterium]|nr:aquaporin [Saprospiraceae bacterium]
MATKTDQTGVFRKYVVEFVGTFFLVMSFCMTLGSGLGQLAPLAIGLTLVMLIYSGGHISGSHLNPAVSLAVYLRGKLDAGDILPYMVGQFLGATAAAMLSGFLLASMETPEPVTKELDIIPALIAELLGTMLYVYVYLNMLTTRKTSGNTYFGLAIGLSFLAASYIFQNISEGAFNPAVALGITMANFTSWSSIWLFLVANFAGGALAAFLSQYVNGPEL